jgi:ferritin-like metal-binding protein YciE
MKKASDKAAEGLRELFEDQLKDIYWAEKALTKLSQKILIILQLKNWLML